MHLENERVFRSPKHPVSHKGSIALYIGSLAKHLLEFSNNGSKTNILDWTKKGFQLYLSVDQ